MPLSAKPMPSSGPGADKNLLGNQLKERGGGGSEIYSLHPEALASSSWREMAAITSRGRHCQAPQMQLHWWGHEKTW